MDSVNTEASINPRACTKSDAAFAPGDIAAPDQSARKSWMSLLAKAPAGRAEALFTDSKASPMPSFDWLRKPEIGSVMVRGRTGGTGAPFNLGEMTVTRCTLKLASGEVGHAYLQGRRKKDAKMAAIVDALMQTDQAAALEAAVLAPLRAEMTQAAEKRARKAAATKVDFFTLVRGDN